MVNSTSNDNCPPYLFVDTPETLERAIAVVSGQPRVALDTEADSLHHYYEKLCLIQLTADGHNFLIDPLAGLDLTRFFESIQDKKLIIHGADYDLRLLRRHCGFTPTRIFDTAIAAQILGYKAFGLGALIERHFGVTLAKSSQRADWSRRPLTDKMLEYAVNDTCRLMQLADILEAELKEAGRVEWRRQACQRLIEDASIDREVDPNGRWRIQGWRKLQGRQVSLLKAAWEWRDNEAKKSDRPSFKILGNDVLLEMAIWVDANPSRDIREFPHLSRLLHGRRLETLRRALKQGLHQEGEDWQRPPVVSRGKRPDPAAMQAVERLRKARNSIAETLQLDPGVLAPNWSLSAIALASPSSVDSLREAGNLMPWQSEAVGETFLGILRQQPVESESEAEISETVAP